MFRNFTKKATRVLSLNDIKELKEGINRLSPYPWSPKFVMGLKKAQDVEFVARSPEVVLKLCEWVQTLYKKLESITFAYNIITCRKCKYWEEVEELESRGVKFGRCKEINNVEIFAKVGSQIWMTPANFGCINGEKNQTIQN